MTEGMLGDGEPCDGSCLEIQGALGSASFGATRKARPDFAALSAV